MENSIEISYGRGFEDGYIKALHDLAELAEMDALKHCITFYDEGFNAGIKKAINCADYLIHVMQSGGVKNYEV